MGEFIAVFVWAGGAYAYIDAGKGWRSYFWPFYLTRDLVSAYLRTAP